MTVTSLHPTTPVDEAQAFLDAAAELDDTHDLIAYYVFPDREVQLHLSTVRQLLADRAEVTRLILTAAADDLEKQSCLDPVLWLRARAVGCTCGQPEACTACGSILCAECSVGEPSRCDHGNGPFCVGCDVDACAGCAHELRMESAPFAEVVNR